MVSAKGRQEIKFIQLIKVQMNVYWESCSKLIWLFKENSFCIEN